MGGPLQVAVAGTLENVRRRDRRVAEPVRMRRIVPRREPDLSSMKNIGNVTEG